MKRMIFSTASVLMTTTVFAAAPNQFTDPSFEKPEPPFVWKPAEKPHTPLKKEKHPIRGAFFCMLT